MANSSLSACVAEIKANSGRFYVYLLSRSCGTPFYVGFGSASKSTPRILDHEIEARTKRRTYRRSNKHKINVILSIWRDGGEVGLAIDRWFDLESDAKRREIELIAEIGRSDLGTGPLTNLTAGGDGAVALTGDGKQRMRAGQLKGAAGRAAWAKANPEAQSAAGRRVGAHKAQWIRDNPEEARKIARAAGKIGIRKAMEVIRSNPAIRQRMGSVSAAVQKQWAIDNPELSLARGRANYAAGAGKWAQENPDMRKAASQKGGRKNAERWAVDPAEHARILAAAVEGRRKKIRENPEAHRIMASYAGSFNKIKAEIRRRCLAMVEVHGPMVTLPPGRAGIAAWRAAETKLVGMLALAA